MYCHECGNKLPDGARFCSACGTPVAAGQTGDVHEGKEAVDTQFGESGIAATSESGLASEREDAESADAASVTCGVPVPAARQSFAGRLIEFRRTTLKAIPTFILAIVAFLAAAGTAYAAYRIVKDVIIPVVEQVQDQVQEESGQEDGDTAISLGQDSNAKENKVAHAAYEKVLDDYRGLLSENADEIDAAGEYGTMLFENKHEFAYTGDFYFYSGETGIMYSYVDIDGDGVDELLMSLSQEQNAEQIPSFVLCGFDHVDGEIVRFAESIVRGSCWLCNDFTIASLGYGGFDTIGFSARRWNGQELTEITSVVWSYVDDADRGNPESPYSVTGTINGEKVERFFPYASLQSEMDSVCGQYEDYADLDWEMLD